MGFSSGVASSSNEDWYEAEEQRHKGQRTCVRVCVCMWVCIGEFIVLGLLVGTCVVSYLFSWGFLDVKGQSVYVVKV